MKCDELKERMLGLTMNEYGCDTKIYLKSEADAAIVELKCENERLNGDIADLRDDRKSSVAIIDELNAENAQLKAKLESVQASMYADVVDANMENRKLKRALWLERAAKAKENQLLWHVYCHCDRLYSSKPFCVTTRKNPYRFISRMNVVEWNEFWGKIINKCRAKAKEYK